MKIAVVAADYTPGEADQLRKDMAAWRRKGGLEKHREKLIQRMQNKGIAPDFAEQVYQQIKGFGSYGFPESHSASFALITYATCWVRCNYRAVFTCALLNSQPLGFYTPASIIHDAKLHGVTVLPIDICKSDYDCTLEPLPAGDFAVRVGLRYLKGVHEFECEELLEAREERRFSSIKDVCQNTRLREDTLVALAKAGAFDSLHPNRREALWQTRGHFKDRQADASIRSIEELPLFAGLSKGEEITWDYRSSIHSTRGHPIEQWREELRKQGFPNAQSLNKLPHNTWIKYAGIVICRQRPGTAKGVIFMTMEDETGFVNIVIWQKTYEQYRLLVKSEKFLAISGRLENQKGVKHLIASQIWKPEIQGRVISLQSRDFR